ncbi:hypothetical protein NBRC116590_13660 [Pelagimonas sp. KU-00592-HH]
MKIGIEIAVNRPNRKAVSNPPTPENRMKIGSKLIKIAPARAIASPVERGFCPRDGKVVVWVMMLIQNHTDWCDLFTLAQMSI